MSNEPSQPPAGDDRKNEHLPYLGAQGRPAVAPAPPDEATISLVRRMHELTPRTWVVPGIVIANVGVYVAMVASGVHFFEPTGADILAWGGNFAGATTRGEWWRLVSCMFLHFGLLHLALNMWALWSVGRLVERLFGNAGFLALYMGAGICGSVASLLWNPDVLSAGASGAVFGVFGALLGIVVRLRGKLPPAFMKSLTRDAAFVIVANLVFTFTAKGIDAAAHLGGLGAGVVFGILLAHPVSSDSAKGRVLRALAVVVLAGVITGTGAWFAARSTGAVVASLEEITKAEQDAVGRYNAATKKLQSGELKEVELAEIIERDVLPVWRAARDKLVPLTKSERRVGEISRRYSEYMRLRDEAWDLLKGALRTGDEAAAKTSMAKNREAEALLKAIKSK